MSGNKYPSLPLDKFKNSLVNISSLFNAFVNFVAISSLLNPSGIVIQISVGPFLSFSKPSLEFFADDDLCVRINQIELALKVSILFDAVRDYIQGRSSDESDVSTRTTELYKELRWLVHNYVSPSWENRSMEALKERWNLYQRT